MPPLPLRKNAVVLLARFPSPVMPAATSVVVVPQAATRARVGSLYTDDVLTFFAGVAVTVPAPPPGASAP